MCLNRIVFMCMMLRDKMRLKCDMCESLLIQSKYGATHYYCPNPRCDVWIEVIEG